MDAVESLLKELTEAPGVSGYEGEVRAVIRRHLAPIAAVEQDRLGSIICRLNGSSGGPPGNDCRAHGRDRLHGAADHGRGFPEVRLPGWLVGSGDVGAARGDQDRQGRPGRRHRCQAAPISSAPRNAIPWWKRRRCT